MSRFLETIFNDPKHQKDFSEKFENCEVRCPVTVEFEKLEKEHFVKHLKESGIKYPFLIKSC